MGFIEGLDCKHKGLRSLENKYPNEEFDFTYDCPCCAYAQQQTDFKTTFGLKGCAHCPLIGLWRDEDAVGDYVERERPCINGLYGKWLDSRNDVVRKGATRDIVSACNTRLEDFDYA